MCVRTSAYLHACMLCSGIGIHNCRKAAICSVCLPESMRWQIRNHLVFYLVSDACRTTCHGEGVTGFFLFSLSLSLFLSLSLSLSLHVICTYRCDL